MKTAPAALLPLIFVGLLTGLTYWLDRTTAAEEQAKKAAARHDPDFIVDRFTVQRFDEKGSLVNSMAAEKMTHFPDDNSSDVIKPEMSFFRSSNPSRLTARTARLLQDGEEVHLQGDVRLMRPAGATPAVLIQSESLTVYPKTELAKSNSPVTITQGSSVVRGSGLEYNGKERVAVLHGRAKGTFNKGKNS